MFERFTERARRVVVLAQEESRLLNHNYIGTEHLLLGLMRARDGLAAQALESLGISSEAARNQVEEVIGQGTAPPSGHIPFAPRAKQVLEMSLREALQLGHNHIGTEHILLSLVREGDGAMAQWLTSAGADLNTVRSVISEMLASGQTDEADTPATRSSTRPARTSAALSDAVDIKQRTALERSALVTLGLVYNHLHRRSWSRPRRNDDRFEAEVRIDADFLAREVSRRGIPANVTLVAELETRLRHALLLLAVNDPTEQADLAALKQIAIDRIGTIESTDDLPDAMAAVDRLALATYAAAEQDPENG